MITVATIGHARNNPRREDFRLYGDAFNFVVNVIKAGNGITIQSVTEKETGCEVMDFSFGGKPIPVEQAAREFLAAINDAFGMSTQRHCRKCGGEMIVIRPGDIRCSKCEN